MKNLFFQCAWAMCLVLMVSGCVPAGNLSGSAGLPTGVTSAGDCNFTLSNPTGYQAAVPASAIGPSYPCQVLAFYDYTTGYSQLIFSTPGASSLGPSISPSSIPNSTQTVSLGYSAFYLLGEDFGASPGLVMSSGDANTCSPLVSLIFSSLPGTNPPLLQGYGNDWINPSQGSVCDPGGAEPLTEQGTWQVKLSSIVTMADNQVLANGQKARLSAVSGSGTLNMLYYNTLTKQTGTITVNISFSDAYNPELVGL